MREGMFCGQGKTGFKQMRNDKRALGTGIQSWSAPNCSVVSYKPSVPFKSRNALNCSDECHSMS
jgi:hypothetical protein